MLANIIFIACGFLFLAVGIRARRPLLIPAGAVIATLGIVLLTSLAQGVPEVVRTLVWVAFGTLIIADQLLDVLRRRAASATE